LLRNRGFESTQNGNRQGFELFDIGLVDIPNYLYINTLRGGFSILQLQMSFASKELLSSSASCAMRISSTSAPAGPGAAGAGAEASPIGPAEGLARKEFLTS
jgi:hypothetical protein